MNNDGLWEQEERARKVDEQIGAFERAYEYCTRCARWHSRYLPHTCEVKNDNEKR